jgi:hypothetical protein
MKLTPECSPYSLRRVGRPHPSDRSEGAGLGQGVSRREEIKATVTVAVSLAES